MRHSYRTEGVVLKHLNLGEADRILTVFSKHYGKIRLVAKGVRKPTSRKAGTIEPFNLVKLVAHRGRTLDILSETETLSSRLAWRKNLKKVAVAYYFCELTDKLTADNQPHRSVYDLLTRSLDRLAVAPKLRPLVRNFEEQLLDALGFGIPTKLRATTGSLRSYIEQITEREINSPKILKSI